MTFCQAFRTTFRQTFCTTFRQTLRTTFCQAFRMTFRTTFCQAFRTTFRTFREDIVTQYHNIVQMTIISIQFVLGHTIQLQTLLHVFQAGS